MEILVTGASGFIGRHLTIALQKISDVNVIPVSRKNIDLPGAIVLENYKDIPLADVIVHLAENPDRNAVNELSVSSTPPSVPILESFLNKGFKNIIYSSSSAVYGDEEATPHKISDPVFGADVYAKAKIMCEKMVLGSSGGLVARFSNLYGPGMSQKNVISKILSQLPCKDVVKIWDDTPIRDFLWIDDAVDLLVKMALSRGSGIYNVGSGVGTSIRELVKQATEIMKCNDCSIEVAHSKNKLSCIQLDITETKKNFNWSPETSLADGLRIILNGHDKAEKING